MTAPRATPVRPLLAMLLCAMGVTAIPMAVGFLQTRHLAALVVRGEAARWRTTVTDALRTVAPPPDDALLERLVAPHRARGLRAVALLPPGQRPVTSEGASAALLNACRDVPRESVTLVGERVIVCAGPMLPPAEHERERPPPFGGPPFGAPPPPRGMPPRFGGGLPPFGAFEGPPREPALAFEFDALAARDLARADTSHLVAWAFALLAMLTLGLLAIRLLREREAIARSLSQARHLSSLGEMSAVLAHEIRNPLASLKGHAQLLAEHLHGDARLSSRADRVVRDATRLERLVDELLAFARTGRLELREVAVEAWARGLAESSGARVAVTFEASPSRWMLDAARLGEAIVNVLRNARESDPEGAVTLRVAREEAALVFEVRDHGPGITAGEEEAIFEPFHTGKVRGTGLGLAIARRTAALHGGTLTARNHPDGGAVFRFSLPDG
jgi:two-component system, NtrC family, sensor histidine kinase HydH